MIFTVFAEAPYGHTLSTANLVIDDTILKMEKRAVMGGGGIARQGKIDPLRGRNTFSLFLFLGRRDWKIQTQTLNLAWGSFFSWHG